MRERFAIAFLVFLRLAIGWHFLFEAVEKHRSIRRGPTETSRPWTSEGFFREGTGPIAALVRGQIGDTDDLTLARFAVQPIPPGADTANYSGHLRMPPALDKEWDSYFKRFQAAYGLNAVEAEAAAKKLLEQKQKLVKTLTTEKKEFKRTYPTGTLDVKLTIVERAAEYRSKVAEYRSVQGDKLWAMGRDVEKARRPALRAEVIGLRTELIKELDAQTADMKKALDDTVKDKVTQNQTLVLAEPIEKPRLIAFIDWSTRWGLTVIGVCLLLGLFSRSASFAGASFLVMTILTAPTLPWLPAAPQTEGNYLFISKNVIEMLALFMLAFMPTGRWFGIDALINTVFRGTGEDND